MKKKKATKLIFVLSKIKLKIISIVFTILSGLLGVISFFKLPKPPFPNVVTRMMTCVDNYEVHYYIRQVLAISALLFINSLVLLITVFKKPKKRE